MRLFSLQNNPRLLVTLLTALVQGALLVWLHTALRESFWPATSMRWLVSLSAVTAAVPLTVQLMSQYWRARALWVIAAAMGALFFYFGWHFGSHVLIDDRQVHADSRGFVFACALGVLWLHFLPFLRIRLSTGRWRSGYSELFAGAWQQALMLAEAALFTGLFWALLMLWATLFSMLGYGFFRWMFSEPAFAYPFTAVAFAIALYLTGSVDRLVTVAREQLLGMLKWLAPVAALILALFAPTLVFKLADLVFHGKSAISAAWLLWLLAFTVLLLNAGYQNGHIEQPYPRPIALFLRFVTPAMVIVAATALYALFVRVAEYGITVERVFALIVGLAGTVYAIGYAFAGLRSGPWMRGIERVNVALAIGIIAVLAITLTPFGSPYRLSASSQSDRAVHTEGEERRSALRYLRFNAGAYGQRALERLAASAGEDKQMQDLRLQAQAVLKSRSYWQEINGNASEVLAADFTVYPAGRTLEPGLIEAVRGAYATGRVLHLRGGATNKPAAVLIDLDGDSVDECVVMTYPHFALFARRPAGWAQVARGILSSGLAGTKVQEALAAGDFSAELSPWRDLRIGRHRLRFERDPSLGMDTQDAH